MLQEHSCRRPLAQTQLLLRPQPACLLAFGRLATSSVNAYSEKSVSWPRFSGSFLEMPCLDWETSPMRAGDTSACGPGAAVIQVHMEIGRAHV